MHKRKRSVNIFDTRIYSSVDIFDTTFLLCICFPQSYVFAKYLRYSGGYFAKF